VRVIVTGATGFVGQHLLPALTDDRHEVVCLVRNVAETSKAEGVAVIEADLSALHGFNLLPSQADAIVHLAQANVPFPEAANELFAVNTSSTQWLAAYARRARVSHFVYASSGSVYARSSKPLKETDAVRPLDFYALTKSCSENVLECYKEIFDVCILRLFAPYGPGQTGRMIPNIIRSVRDGKSVTIVNGGQPRINPIYIDDLTAIIVQALPLTGYHVVNVAGPQAVSVQDVALIASDLLGATPVFEFRTEPETWNAIADTARMCELFDARQLHGVAEGMRQMVGRS
jgi:UDP-glucose 4-epimerase